MNFRPSCDFVTDRYQPRSLLAAQYRWAKNCWKRWGPIQRVRRAMDAVVLKRTQLVRLLNIRLLEQPGSRLHPLPARRTDLQQAASLAHRLPLADVRRVSDDQRVVLVE